jgi:phosphate:Na+ symporter
MITEILPLLVGGLVLFLYAIFQLSDVMSAVFTERAQKVIKRYTSNAVKGVLIGTIATILLGSSSAVIILTIVFINSKALNFRQAIGIILGANIGTTFSSQLISFDIGRYAFILLLIGLVVTFVAKSSRWKNYGNSMLYLGMLFFGLFVIESSVEPLHDSERFLNWLSRLDNPWRGALMGGLVTLVIQSSSATVGLAIVLGKQELLSLAGGIAVMLGAELGTCSDTLLATIKGSREALRAGIFHVVFNMTTIGFGLVLFDPFVDLVCWLTASDDLNRLIANAHMLFNVLGVLLVLPFTSLADRMLRRWIPENKIKQQVLASDKL